MGIIIKYQLEFPDISLTVSNDLLKGDFILDADINVVMSRRKAGCSFKIDLYDLPMTKAKEIQKLIGQPPKIVIRLGYFDDPFAKVLDGFIDKIQTAVKGDKLITTLKGKEVATYILNTKKSDFKIKDELVDDLIKKILENAKVANVKVESTLTALSSGVLLVRDRTYRKGRSLAAIIDEVAQQTRAESFIIDQKIWLGKPIKNDDYKPKKFDENINLANFSLITKEVTQEMNPNLLEPVKNDQIEGFKFVIAGDPKLRPGQKVSTATDDSLISAVASFVPGAAADFDQTEFRVHSLVHNFTTSAGYTCEGVAMKSLSPKTATTTGAGDDYRSREAMLDRPNAESVTEKFLKRNESENRNRPVIEIGAIKSYTPGKAPKSQHLSSLYFGQRFEETETQPSFQVEVDVFENQLFQNKPIASPFAWHKCGLVTPIYPGMKALLSHNLGLQDDAIISGFTWSKKPEIKPPKNKEGDWWLCLPISPENPPKDDTKAANDLTANNGRRVIEVKGLKITIGESSLKKIGERPTEGKNDEFLIEHSSGSKILIKDGTIEMTNGSVTLKLSKSSVEIF